jgi:hypothetical protein
MRFRRNVRLVALAALLAAISFAVVAFTDSNTFPGGTPKAGDGSATISGYAVTGVSYVLNASNPQSVDKVKFTLDAPATTVKAKLLSAGSWYSCSEDASVTANDWECATTSPQGTVASAAQLTVVAAA